MNELIPLNEVKEMAKHATASNLFGMPNAESAFSLMMLCQAEGLHPMQAMRKYHIIEGKPAMRAEAMLADFQSNGGKIQWIERNDKKCSAKFSHPSGGELTVEWTIERAQQAGLTTKKNWLRYPCQMLAARCVSEGVRAVYPAVVCGIYTPEEVQDFAPAKKEEDEDKNLQTIYEEIKAREPEEPKPTKVETIKADVVEAEIVEEPKQTTAAMVKAEKIKKARKHLMELGYKTAAVFETVTEKVIGRKCSNLTSLSIDELDKIIEFKGEN